MLKIASNKIILILLTVLVLSSYGCENKSKVLPVMGKMEITGTDTIFHQIPPFSFVNQNGEEITEKSVEKKVYVVDFFFVSCPTICPVMAKNMRTVYERFQSRNDFMILSHTLDTEHDSVERLKMYADRLGVSSPTWQFLTGDRDAIYDIGQSWYMTTAKEDSNEAGGYLHDGSFILLDKHRRIRGIYSGTDEKSVALLISDIQLLLR